MLSFSHSKFFYGLQNHSPCFARVLDMDELDCLIEKSYNLFREGKLYSSIVPYFCFQLLHS